MTTVISIVSRIILGAAGLGGSGLGISPIIWVIRRRRARRMALWAHTASLPPPPVTAQPRHPMEPTWMREQATMSTEAQAARLIAPLGYASPLASGWQLPTALIGRPPRLYLPGHGAYYLAWETRPQYRLAGYIEKNRLIFLMDNEFVEMTFASKVLVAAEGGPVWVYHDPSFVSKDGAELAAADPEALHAKK